MGKTYEYYQPEYVSKFQCDRQKCSAQCCKNWAITIDKKTYKQYSHLKPKSAAREITRHIQKKGDIYQMIFDESLHCPFLTEDNGCKIKNEYGEEYLSAACITYPRCTWDLGDFYECSLRLTCPIAAEQILLADEPMKFEHVEVSEKIHNNFGKTQMNQIELPAPLENKMILVQETAISILQERTLTIDERLLIEGLYFDKLEELLVETQIYELEKVNIAYKDPIFLKEQANQVSAVLKFNANEYVEAMLNFLKTLYDTGRIRTLDDKKYIDAVMSALQINQDETSEIKISAVAERYNALNTERKNFVKQFENIFENYLVNEIFMNVYPFRFVDHMNYNYGIFTTFYKVMELLTFSMSLKQNLTEKDLVSGIIWYSNVSDNNAGYTKRISEYIKEKNPFDIMQGLLQV